MRLSQISGVRLTKVQVVCVYVRVFGNTYITCSIRGPFSDQFLCVDAYKAKEMNENSKGTKVHTYEIERRGRNEKQVL